MSSDIQECPPCDKGAPKWVTTFGDLMSLLLCFFVLLLSFSEIDRQKYKVVAGSMEKAFGMQRKKNVSESPRHGLKMIAKDFDQEAIATRVKEFIGRELEENFDELYGKLKTTSRSKPKKPSDHPHDGREHIRLGQSRDQARTQTPDPCASARF
jgi:flagellar motor protein MotB